MNKENKHTANTDRQASPSKDKDAKPPVPCKFEELKDEFLIQREIGRGKYFFLTDNLR